jgi:hypothetical protein
VAAASALGGEMPVRPVVLDITTHRLVYGAPYDLAGKRVVFTNWHYIPSGDVGWVDAEGRPINYERGDCDVLAARHVGPLAPRGIRIMAQRPEVLGPLEGLPPRGMMQDGRVYKAYFQLYQAKIFGIEFE